MPCSKSALHHIFCLPNSHLPPPAHPPAVVVTCVCACVQAGELTDEYRVAFRHEVRSAEDAKSEMLKLFQEAWEREQGYFYADDLPAITKYAEDILRGRTKA